MERLADSGRETEGRGRSTTVPLSPTRRAIAARLTEVAAIPQVDNLPNRGPHGARGRSSDLGVSPLPLLARALAEVCREHPELNASWDGERIILFQIRVGIATDTERGLMVPRARRRRFARDQRDRGRDRAARRGGALSNMLSRDDVVGGTIAVTNTGSYAPESGTPLLNPGHAVTIAPGVIEPRALVVDGVVEARPACTLSS